MNQKGISSIVIILIVVGFLVVGGAIWYWQNQIKQFSIDGSIEETTNWETYRNEKYGFEFKYPNNFSYEDTQEYTSNVQGRIVRETLSGKEIKFAESDKYIEWKNRPWVDGPSIPSSPFDITIEVVSDEYVNKELGNIVIASYSHWYSFHNDPGFNLLSRNLRKGGDDYQSEVVKGYSFIGGPCGRSEGYGDLSLQMIIIFVKTDINLFACANLLRNVSEDTETGLVQHELTNYDNILRVMLGTIKFNTITPRTKPLPDAPSRG